MSRDVSTSPHSRRRVTSVTLAMLLALVSAYALPGAQAPAKKPLTVDDYTKWRSITDSAISGDGKWATYALQLTNTIPAEAKPILHLRNLETNEDVTVQDATGGTFSADSKWIAYQVDPGAAERARRDRGPSSGSGKRRDDSAGCHPAGRSRRTAVGSRAAARDRSGDRPASDCACGPGDAAAGSKRHSSSVSRARSASRARFSAGRTGKLRTGPFDRLRTRPRKRCIDNPAAARRTAEPGGRDGAIVAGHRLVYLLAHLHSPDPPSSCAGRCGRRRTWRSSRRTGRRRRDRAVAERRRAEVVVRATRRRVRAGWMSSSSTSGPAVISCSAASGTSPSIARAASSLTRWTPR